MKVVIDMNMSIGWVDVLVDVGIDAVHWSGIGDGDTPDDEIMAWAQANDAVVLTRDLGFGAVITMLGLRSPSVIQFRMKQVHHEIHADRLKRVLSLQHVELTRGAIVTIDTDRVRVRRLQTDDLL